MKSVDTCWRLLEPDSVMSQISAERMIKPTQSMWPPWNSNRHQHVSTTWWQCVKDNTSPMRVLHLGVGPPKSSGLPSPEVGAHITSLGLTWCSPKQHCCKHSSNLKQHHLRPFQWQKLEANIVKPNTKHLWRWIWLPTNIHPFQLVEGDHWDTSLQVLKASHQSGVNLQRTACRWVWNGVSGIQTCKTHLKPRGTGP